MADKAQRFTATLERGLEGMGWTVVRIPFDPRAVWKQMVRLRVRGEVRSAKGVGVAFRSSLFPVLGGGGLCLMVNNRLQREAGLSLGSVAEFSLEPDLEPRPAELPDALAELLDEEDGLREWYDALSESMRREIGKWIFVAKSEESQVKRCEQMAERLLAAMEGEQELPPVIAAEKMTAVQRRQHLLGVFYYQSPEAREKRVGKLCDEAEKRA
jgi:hypothetical protein